MSRLTSEGPGVTRSGLLSPRRLAISHPRTVLCNCLDHSSKPKLKELCGFKSVRGPVERPWIRVEWMNDGWGQHALPMLSFLALWAEMQHAHKLQTAKEERNGITYCASIIKHSFNTGQDMEGLVGHNKDLARREGWGEGIVREFGMDMYILLYLKWKTRKDLV